jgi:periplasmic copper chaperone A
MRLLTTAASILIFLTGAAFAGDMTKHGDLMVKDVWSRATPARNGVAYMTIFNQGQGMDRLIAVESPVAKKVELHTHSMKDGVMRMRQISAVEVHPGEPAVLAPGGNHVMLMGLHRKLKAGENFAVTLVFEKAGKVTVDVAVGKAGAMGHGAPKMQHKHGDHKMDHKKHGS